MTDAEEYRHILVVAEPFIPEGIPVTLELLGKARELGDLLGAWVYVAVLSVDGTRSETSGARPKGDDTERPPLQGQPQISDGNDLIAYGADVVYIVKAEASDGKKDSDSEWFLKCESSLDQIIKQVRPEIIIFSGSPFGSDLAPRMAQRLGTGLVTGCMKLDLDVESRMLVATRPAYQGLLLVEVVFPHHRPQMVTVNQGVFPQAFEDPSREGSVEEIRLRRT
jgi:electron transfer flavoprotein alpha subunit